jgi:Ca2+/Na+ antiporter
MNNVSFKDAVGIGMAWISEEHIFTFMLSSAFTARNMVKEKGDIEGVKKDLYISLILSIATSILLAYFFQSWAVAIAGCLFALLLYYIYVKRGEL